MTILILGGTGAMGTHLVDILRRGNLDVTVTSRTQNGLKDGICYVRGDAQHNNFLTDILKQQRWDAIIDFMVYSTLGFQARAKSLLDATDQYIFLSSARVYADTNEPLTENSPRLLDVSTDQDYLQTDEYALSKARQENILTDSRRSNWTIIRPYITFSDQRLQLGVLEKEDWLFRALGGRAVVFSSDINIRTTTLTHGANVALGIRSLIGQPAALGEAFHITSNRSFLWSDVLETYVSTLKKHLGSGPRICLVDLPTFMRTHTGKYQIIYDRLFNRRFNNDKIAHFLNLESFADPLLALQSSLKFFLNDPKFKYISGKTEALRDLVTGERTPLAQLPDLKQRLHYAVVRNTFTNY